MKRILIPLVMVLSCLTSANVQAIKWSEAPELATPVATDDSKHFMIYDSNDDQIC